MSAPPPNTKLGVLLAEAFEVVQDEGKNIG